jgi:hypothetical protein
MTTTETTLALTPKQWDLVDHRLACDDSLGDCLAEDFAPDAEGDYEHGFYHHVRDVCDRLLAGWDGKRLDVSAAYALDEPLARAILADAVNGSTWVACASCEPDHVVASACRTAHAVERKLGEFLGLDLECPLV